MSAARGDTELASIMRKLLRAPDGFVAVNRHVPGAVEFTFDDTSVFLTEDELQALEEAIAE